MHDYKVNNKLDIICFVYIPNKLFCSKCNNVLISNYKGEINERICINCNNKKLFCITKNCYNICYKSNIICYSCKKNKKFIKSKICYYSFI